MITINLAILNGQIGDFYLSKPVRDYRQLDSTVRVQGSISVAVDVAGHVKSTTPSTFIWFKKTPDCFGLFGCPLTLLRVFVCLFHWY